MKKLLILVTIIFISTSLKAEYNGYHIKFTIENLNGQKSKGFAYVASAYLNMDSLKNSEYLKKALDQSYNKDWDKKDSLTYFKVRLKYEYADVWDSSGHKNPVYYLTRKTKLSFKSIKTITIDELIDFGYLIGIANELKLTDSTWMKKEPVRKVSFGGYLCSYQIFIHVNSPKVNEIIKQLEKKQKEIDSIEIDSKNGDKIDDELSKIIQQLNKQKVVVISECTC